MPHFNLPIDAICVIAKSIAAQKAKASPNADLIQLLQNAETKLFTVELEEAIKILKTASAQVNDAAESARLSFVIADCYLTMQNWANAQLLLQELAKAEWQESSITEKLASCAFELQQQQLQQETMQLIAAQNATEILSNAVLLKNKTTLKHKIINKLQYDGLRSLLISVILQLEDVLYSDADRNEIVLLLAQQLSKEMKELSLIDKLFFKLNGDYIFEDPKQCYKNIGNVIADFRSKQTPRTLDLGLKLNIG